MERQRNFIYNSLQSFLNKRYTVVPTKNLNILANLKKSLYNKIIYNEAAKCVFNSWIR